MCLYPSGRSKLSAALPFCSRAHLAKGEILPFLALELLDLTALTLLLFSTTLLPCHIPLPVSLRSLLFPVLAQSLAITALFLVLTAERLTDIGFELNCPGFGILDAACNHGVESLEVSSLRARWQTFIVGFGIPSRLHLRWATHPGATTHSFIISIARFF